MANNRTLRKVFAQVQTQLDSGRYTWISQDNSPEDYFDWGMSHQTTSQDIIESMIQEGDLKQILTYEEFVALAENNAHNDQWLFGEGWEMVHEYPEYSDRYILQSLAKTFGPREPA